MNAQDKIDEIAVLVEGARAMPMSASCIVNRGELLARLDELRALLPAELREAEYVLRDREGVVEEGRAEAERILAEARAERSRLVSDTEVAAEAGRAADLVVEEARRQARQMRTEVDEYVDAKLAHFEVLLQRTLSAVARGRDKLHGEIETLGAGGLTAELDEDASPH